MLDQPAPNGSTQGHAGGHHLVLRPCGIGGAVPDFSYTYYISARLQPAARALYFPPEDEALH
jgi:hypothetical protein